MKSAVSVAELLAIPLPEGQASEALQYLWPRTKALLRNPDAQAVFLRDLPSYSVEQLVRLWDVFWVNDAGLAGGFAAYGPGFGPAVTAQLADMIATHPDAGVRKMALNLLAPDSRHLSDRRSEELRAALLGSPDPELRRGAEKLPRR